MEEVTEEGAATAALAAVVAAARAGAETAVGEAAVVI